MHEIKTRPGYWVTVLCVLSCFAGGADGIELATEAGEFTIDGKPTFLFGISYYGALGASVPISPYGWDPVFFSGVGGIEFGFRAAPSLAWDIEFGIAYATDGQLSMVFGAGIHFYF